jgi:hypothetical protein
MTIAVKSQWMSSNHQLFTVTALRVDGLHTWVHYQGPDGREYSCYEESFRARFRPHIQ